MCALQYISAGVSHRCGLTSLQAFERFCEGAWLSLRLLMAWYARSLSTIQQDLAIVDSSRCDASCVFSDDTYGDFRVSEDDLIRAGPIMLASPKPVLC